MKLTNTIYSGINEFIPLYVVVLDKCEKTGYGVSRFFNTYTQFNITNKLKLFTIGEVPRAK